MRRAIIGVAVAILSLYALYVVAVNVFLSTSLFEKVVLGSPDTLFISYERAWSVWPGSIHVRRLLLRGSDSHVQWLLRIERCTFDVAITDLATRHKFHIDRARGAGVTFEARQRLDAPALTPEYVDALPPIPGFDRIPFKDQKPTDLKERWDDDFYHLWTFELTDVVADDVREVWIDSLRLEGAARITGGFFLKPIRKVHVGPAHVDARAVRMSVKDRPVGTDVTGTLDLTIEDFDPRVVTKPDLVHRLSVSSDLRGQMPDLGNLPRTMTGAMTLGGAADVRRLALHVVRGKLEAGAQADIYVHGARVQVAGHHISGELEATADVPGGAEPRALEIRLETRALRAGRMGEDGDIARAGSLVVKASTTALDLAETPHTFRVAADLPDGQIVDHAVARRFVHGRGAPQIAEGRDRFEVHAELDVEKDVGKGSADVHAPDLGVVLPTFAVSAEVRAHAGVHEWALDDGTMVLDEARVALTNVVAQRSGRAAPALAVSRIAASAKSQRLSLADPLARLDLSAAIAGGRLLDPNVLDPLLPDGGAIAFDASPGGGRFSAEAELGVDRHVARGKASAHAGGVGVRAPRLRARGDVTAEVVVSAWRLDDGHLTLTGGMARVDDLAVQFGATGARESAPTSAADLRSKSVEVRASAIDVDLATPSLHGVDYRVLVEGAEMDDASRLGAVFPPRASPPAFAIESGKAQASADIVVSPSRRTATGGAKVALSGAGLRFHETRLRGQFDVDLHVAGLVPDSGSAIDIAGSRVSLRGIQTVGAKARTEAWSGDLALLGGTLRISDEPGFDGFVQLHADDANPILALALGNDLPRFVVGRLRAPGLSGQARLVLEPGRAAILDAHARGDNVVVIGDYVVRPEHRRGAFTVAKGAVSAGVKLDDEGTYLRLFGLEDWRRDEKRAVLALFASAPPPPEPAPPSAPPQPAPVPARADGVPARALDVKAKTARP